MTNQTKTEAPLDVVKEAAENTADKAEKLVQNVAQSTEQVTENTVEVVKSVTSETSKHLEHTTNQTLEFFGFSMDIHTLIDSGLEIGVKFVLALIVFFVGKWVGTRIVNVAKRVMKRSQMDATVANFVGNVLYGLMLVAVIVAALNKLGINTNSFVAILGGAAVAIGVSLKDQLGNLAAGVMIVVFRPFSRGDTVEVSGKLGTVIDITLVNTRIRTANNHEIIIPNGDIMTTASVNYSSLPNRRIEVRVGISYESDIQTARKIMLDLTLQHELILKDNEPIVRVTALNDNAVELTLYAWTNNGDWWGVQCDLLEQIKYAFDDQNVGIPYPQRTIHIEGVGELIKATTQKTISQSVNDAIEQSEPAKRTNPADAPPDVTS